MSSRKSRFQSLVRSLSASVANAIAEWQKEQSSTTKPSGLIPKRGKYLQKTSASWTAGSPGAVTICLLHSNVDWINFAPDCCAIARAPTMSCPLNPTWIDRLWVKEIRDEKTVQRCLVDALRYCDRRLVLGGGCYSGGIDAGGNRTGAVIRRQSRQQESRCHGSALHLGWSLSLAVWPDRAWSGRPPELLREALCLRCPQPCD